MNCQWFTSRLSALTSPPSGLVCDVRKAHRWVQRGQMVVIKGGPLTLALFREVQKEGRPLVSVAGA